MQHVGGLSNNLTIMSHNVYHGIATIIAPSKSNDQSYSRKRLTGRLRTHNLKRG